MFNLYLLNLREEIFLRCARSFGVESCVLFGGAKLVTEATIFDFCTLALILKGCVSLEGSYGCTKGRMLFQCRT